ncbi:MAG: hypothetical protein CL610_23120 [Anaerolineaceae bacterium]|nr:hypothetical protein [Anaerolineaceae bacterium]
MTDQIILTLPEDLSERARRIAESTAQPVEQVLLNHLRTLSEPLPALPPDVQAELDALKSLSDDTLWTIARDQMPEDAQSRAQILMDRNSSGQITDAEYAELENLAQRADRLMLRKAEAAALLNQRGHIFSQSDFTASHE